MSELSGAQIQELLQPYLKNFAPHEDLFRQLGTYLELLLRWNARMNLTAIREPEEIVRRHFGESLFAAAQLEERLPSGATLLDYGSGAGFPGIPIQLAMPQLRCCLAESQGKKAAFLRETVRTLGLSSEIWAGRVEDMPASRVFDCVTLRAVDRMEAALASGQERLARGGFLAVLGSLSPKDSVASSPLFDETFYTMEQFAVPGGHSRVLYLYRRNS